MPLGLPDAGPVGHVGPGVGRRDAGAPAGVRPGHRGRGADHARPRDGRGRAARGSSKWSRARRGRRLRSPTTRSPQPSRSAGTTSRPRPAWPSTCPPPARPNRGSHSRPDGALLHDAQRVVRDAKAPQPFWFYLSRRTSTAADGRIPGPCGRVLGANTGAVLLPPGALANLRWWHVARAEGLEAELRGHVADRADRISRRSARHGSPGSVRGTSGWRRSSDELGVGRDRHRSGTVVCDLAPRASASSSWRAVVTRIPTRLRSASSPTRTRTEPGDRCHAERREMRTAQSTRHDPGAPPRGPRQTPRAAAGGSRGPGREQRGTSVRAENTPTRPRNPAVSGGAGRGAGRTRTAGVLRVARDTLGVVQEHAGHGLLCEPRFGAGGGQCSARPAAACS